MNRYNITVDINPNDLVKLEAMLIASGAKIVGVSAEEKRYAMNLIHEGYMVDSVTVTAHSLQEATDNALQHFKDEAPYDITDTEADPRFLKEDDITTEMVELDRD